MRKKKQTSEKQKKAEIAFFFVAKFRFFFSKFHFFFFKFRFFLVFYCDFSNFQGNQRKEELLKFPDFEETVDFFFNSVDFE